MLTIMRENDLTICVQLYLSVFHGAPWFYDWLTEDKAHRYFSDLMKTPGFIGFLYTSEVKGQANALTGVCLGCVSDYFNAPIYDIKEIFIDTAYQRKGIGTQLLSEIETTLAARDISYITLLTDRSIPAYDFYMKNKYLCSEQTVSMYKQIL